MKKAWPVRALPLLIVLFAGTVSLVAQTVTIDRNNAPPNGEVNLGYPFTNEGLGFTFSATTTGNSQFLSWSLAPGSNPLPTGLTLDGNTGVLGGNNGSGPNEVPTVAGTYTFTVMVTDHCDCDTLPTDQAQFTVTIFPPLEITSPSTIPAAVLGQPYSYSFTAEGGDQTQLQWSIFDEEGPFCGNHGLPPGLCLSVAGVLSGTPTALGPYSFDVALFDNDIQNTIDPFINITVNPAPAPPSGPPPLFISGPSNIGTIALGSPISAAVNVSGGTPSYTLKATGLPAGVTLSGSSFAGTPTAPGVYSVVVTATDSGGATATVTIGFSVFGITTSSLTPAITYSPYSVTITAAGGTSPYTFTGSGLPPGFTLSGAGLLSGKSTVKATYTISVTATDAKGVSNSASFPFAVNAPLPLTVSGGPLPGSTVFTPYSQTLTASGGAPPYVWTLAGGALPDGTSLQAAGPVAGMPDKTGSYTFSVRATDQTGAAAVGTFSLNVAAQPVTITTPSPLSSGMVTVDYPVQVLSAAGGSGPYTFAVSAGAVPAGLTLDPNGAISGIPTTVGSYKFTLTATDSNGQTGSAPFQMTVRPFSADLTLSAGSLSFSLAAGATPLAGSQSIQVEATDVTKVVSWSAAVTPAVSWLSLASGSASGGTTPGFFSVALTGAASSLAASTTPYQATIVVSCLAPSPCAGNTQTIAVSLLVAAAPPQLTVLTNLLSFTTSSANPQATAQSVVIENTGGGSIGFASFTCPQTWCQVSAIPVSIGTQTINVTADPTGLSPGYYYTNLTIGTPVATAVVPITFFIAPNSSLDLLPAGIQLIMPAGGVAAVPQSSFLVSASGSSPIAWTATVLPGAPWLNLTTTSGSSTGSAPGAVNFSINQAAAAALTPQAYYATIRIASASAVNSPQDFLVVLLVTAATSLQKPNPSPAGLLFLTTAAGAPAPQVVQVLASSVPPVNYQASVLTADGNAWLAVSPASGSTSASSPAQSSVTVTPAGLTPGVYHGSVSYSFSAAAVRSVNVTLVVEAAGLAPSQRTGDLSARALSSSAQSSSAQSSSAQSGCAPTHLVPTESGLVNNFSAPASWPTPLAIQLNDDCGNPVATGQIVATFTNGDSPLALTLGNPASGLYSGTWTPRKTGAQVAITATATAPGFSMATVQISGSVVPNSAPVLTPNGTLHVFTPEAGAPLAPGTIVQIYGTGLATQTLANTTIPLVTSLAGTSVIIGGLQAPLYFVSPAQVNAQIPFELTAGAPYQVIVNNNGALSTPLTLQTDAAAPGTAAYPSGYAIAQHVSDNSLVTDASPAKPGEYVVLYLAGMGPTTVPVASGAAAPSSPLAQTVNTPTITLNSEPVSILFSGLTPGLAGLYQIDLQIPADASNGDQTLVVNQPGIQQGSVILPVHN